MNNYNGIINVYKEAGFTSFDVVAKLRGICGQKKIGHTGTLDPEATGVLPVCLGNATGVCELLMDHDKEYVAEMMLGITTDTQDTTGRITAEHGAEKIPDEAEITKVIHEFTGEIMQVPPMYSALKVNGQKLCDLARKGIEVERKARKITVHEIEILEINIPKVKIRVHCSKGTYIRTLCNDIGEKLGCGAAMSSLVRTRVGIFGIDSAVRLDEIQKLRDEGRLAENIISVDSIFEDYPGLTVNEAAMKLLLNGNVLKKSDFDTDSCHGLNSESGSEGNFRIYRTDGSFAGIYYYSASDGLYKPKKMFL